MVFSRAGEDGTMKAGDACMAGMERQMHRKYRLCLVLCLTLLVLTFSSALPGWSQDGASIFPEGSGSIITPLSWQFSGQDQQDQQDQADMHAEVRAVIQQFEAAVLVKDEKDLLVLSLPSAKLTELRDKLEELGTVTSSESSSAPKAPTTLLRLTLQSSSL